MMVSIHLVACLLPIAPGQLFLSHTTYHLGCVRMKQQFFMLSLLIPSPSASGNDIHVYLQPLIYELQELWEHGVTTYDVASKKIFSMHTTLL